MNTSLFSPERREQGFGVVEVLLVLLVVVVLGGGGTYLYYREHKAKGTTGSASQTHSSSSSENNTTPQPKPDPYAGWKGYSNSTYGITFKYPTTWTLTEGAVNSPDSATKQEYAINLKRNADVKYNDTASIEVLGEDLNTAAAWYDRYYAQSPLNQVTKTTTDLKGKQSVQYAVTNSGVQSKLYLFSVAGKTYSFWSVNEQLNVQADSNYWSAFDGVFDSLQISS